MKSSMRRFTSVTLFTFFIIQSVFPQAGITAVPFLLINPSTEANGMGGTMMSSSPTSPSSMMFNPAQLGMMSRTHSFGSEFYTNPVSWLPTFSLSDLWLNTYSMMYGMQLGDAYPNNISIGIGYSRMFLNLGEFIITSERGPNPIIQFTGAEEVDNYSLGFSMDVGPIIGFGTTVKRIQSHLLPFGTSGTLLTGSADVTAVDLGIITRFPLITLLVPHHQSIPRGVMPTVDVTLSYAMNNLGGTVDYGDPNQADPLPRTARIGWSFETGIAIATASSFMNFVQLTITREAADILATRTSDGAIGSYQGPLGDIDVYKGLILGRQHSYVDIRRGFSVNMLETITYRQGSFDGDGNLVYKTNGVSYSTRGLFTLAGSLIDDETRSPFVKYFLKHFEVRVSQSEYTGYSAVSGTKFKSILFSFYQ